MQKDWPIKCGHGKETDYGSGKHISRSVDLQVVRLEFVSLPLSRVLRMSHGGDGDAERGWRGVDGDNDVVYTVQLHKA